MPVSLDTGGARVHQFGAVVVRNFGRLAARTIIGGEVSTSGHDIIQALREAGYDGTVRLWGSVTPGTGRKVLSEAPIEIDLGLRGGGATRRTQVRPET